MESTFPKFKADEFEMQTRYSSQSERAIAVARDILVGGLPTRAVADKYSITTAHAYQYVTAFLYRGRALRARYRQADIAKLFATHKTFSEYLEQLMMYWCNGYSITYISNSTSSPRSEVSHIITLSRNYVIRHLAPVTLKIPGNPEERFASPLRGEQR